MGDRDIGMVIPQLAADLTQSSRFRYGSGPTKDKAMDATTFGFHIGAALVMGLLIGLERQWRQHTAGLRTNALVALGSALFVSLSFLLQKDDSPTRIAAQVVSGLGFLGGGVILREGINIRGLNTAATIWCSGAIGCLAGSGYPWEAAIGTVAVLIVNISLRPIVHRIEVYRHTAGNVESLYRIHVKCRRIGEPDIRKHVLELLATNHRMTVQCLGTEGNDTERPTVTAEVYSAERDDPFIEGVVIKLGSDATALAANWQRLPG
jgi:putative Mg2+ transporter-C (MgtC) family protein